MTTGLGLVSFRGVASSIIEGVHILIFVFCRKIFFWIQFFYGLQARIYKHKMDFRKKSK